ncbi:3-hydroxybutyryl-CoA dehydrogenase [Tumebacillus avium]|uniref:3-hydroxybutyryl-CoA dehydrogenase n=1 Tax=Tumebacillus avium TaxID=1903704 RepID=A0A1Y0IQP7_9BACL|nr:3-hydroxyacyl-CoA dehydrogenase NAD-binding domain-containing protein [Tumebacillus avium]ARU62908.1 3-hydroxybutyryl-CoA dehydrogenase [Tumebacillus avium]
MNIQHVGIIGAGTMGQGIAQAIAGKGLDVVLLDQTQAELEQARQGLELALDRRLTKWGITEAEKKVILSRIQLTTDANELRECELVIECVWEQLEAKSEALQLAERVVGPKAILASNTSTLSLTEIAAQTEHPERVIGLHFHYPPERRELVEVVRGLNTSQATFHAAFEFVKGLGKTAIQVYESPGYVTSRLMLPLINEAAAIVAEGVASERDVDTAMKVGYGFSYGPLEIADLFGLDSVVDMLEGLYFETADPRYRPAAYLRKLVRAGHLGMKARQGFYRYDEAGEVQA